MSGSATIRTLFRFRSKTVGKNGRSLILPPINMFCFPVLDIFWKLLISFPEESDLASDWLEAKFKKGTVPNREPGSKVSA